MKKVIIALALLALAGVAAGGYWMLRQPAPPWTTSSAEALAEFELGFAALSKLYHQEAREHFVRAVELDPEFLIAKLHLAIYTEKPARDDLQGELATADLSRVTAQERFLVEYWLARNAETPSRDPAEILDTFLDEYPDNFHGLRHRCESLWRAQDWEPAGDCYQRLLDLHPNWVRAQNFLGYIAMARGRFSEAEEHFSTYRYVAPDQANPHDSMAELHITLGRYEEAEASLQKAIEIKPDFCHAYQLRAQIGLFSGQFEIVEKALADLESHSACDWAETTGYSCMMSANVLHFSGDSEGAWQVFENGCLKRLRGADLIAHRVAMMTGREDRALKMEATFRELRNQAQSEGRPEDAKYFGAGLAHMQGVRALATGDSSVAVELLSKADQMLGYLGIERASFKLFHRINLIHALELAGQDMAAEALRRKIEAVNPRVLQDVILEDFDLKDRALKDRALEHRADGAAGERNPSASPS